MTPVEDQLAQLKAEVSELFDIMEARKTLDAGFIGMGKNIMEEKAGRLLSQIR